LKKLYRSKRIKKKKIIFGKFWRIEDIREEVKNVKVNDRDCDEVFRFTR